MKLIHELTVNEYMSREKGSCLSHRGGGPLGEWPTLVSMGGGSWSCHGLVQAPTIVSSAAVASPLSGVVVGKAKVLSGGSAYLIESIYKPIKQ